MINILFFATTTFLFSTSISNQFLVTKLILARAKVLVADRRKNKKAEALFLRKTGLLV